MFLDAFGHSRLGAPQLTQKILTSNFIRYIKLNHVPSNPIYFYFTFIGGDMSTQRYMDQNLDRQTFPQLIRDLSRNVFRRALGLAFAAAVLSIFMGTYFAQATTAWAQTASGSGTKAYNIPAGPLENALRSFVDASGTRLVYRPALTKGKTTSGLHGTYSVEEGLAKLLAGTGLRVVRKAEGKLALVAQSPTPDDEASMTLPKVTVQGNQLPPGTYDISRELLQRTMAEDMADVFATEPSVSIGGGGRNAQRLYLRGIESNNLNITIDGAQQGRSLHQHRGDIGGIEPWLLKRVEVQPGPGAADRGPGGLGGGIAFETVDAQDLLDADKSVGATIRSAYGTVDESWLGGGAIYGRFRKVFGLLASASAINREDYTIGDDGGNAPNTSGQDRDFFVKFSMLELAGHSLRLSAARNTESGHYIWGSNGSDMGYPTDTSVANYTETMRDTFTIDHRFNPASKLIDTKLSLYINRNSIDNQDYGTKYTSDNKGGDVRNTFSFNLGPTAHRLTVGADFVSEDSKAELSDVPDKSNDSRNLGLFIQDRMTIGPVGISLGARFDDYQADFGPYNISGSEISPNLSATYEVIKGLTAFAGYGQAVRGSGIIPGSWMANIDSNTTFEITEPESSQQIEGGLRYNIDGLFLAHDHLRVEGTLFETKLENTIEAEGRRGIISSIKNGDTIYSRGWEVRLGWGRHNFRTSLGFTHVDTEDEDGNPVGVLRRKAASSGDRLVWDNYWLPIDSLTLGYTLIAVGRLDDVPEGESERPGYALHNLQLEWRPAFLANLSLSLVVNNLFDVRYSEQTTIISSATGVVEEPGRNFRFGITYRF
jgi:hemoglobin/transferrin/lactoferrin receptor protein